MLKVIELINDGKYPQGNCILQEIYEGLQANFPRNIHEVYFKGDRIGYSRWKNTELNEIGSNIQKILVYLYKKKFIDANSVVAYIEGSEKMRGLANIEANDTLMVMSVLDGESLILWRILIFI